MAIVDIKNTKIRTLILFAGGILITGITIAILNAGKAGPDDETKQSKTVGVPQGIESTPGEKTTEKYRQLQAQANLAGSKEAAESGSSFVPTLIGALPPGEETDLQSQFLDALKDIDVPDEQKSKLGLQNPQLSSLLEQQRRQQQEEDEFQKRQVAQQAAEQMLAQQEARTKAIQTISSSMDQQGNELLAAWKEVNMQTYVAGELNEENSKAKQKNQQDSNDKAPVILKAGSILFAVLETSVNTDEPGPIMAKIVQSPLKNSKLIGSISVTSDNAEKANLNFTTINIPGQAISYPIQAVAIDPDTARTAIASDVDHHYFMRWGSLFASAFLEGYSKAVAKSGATTTTTTSNVPGQRGSTSIANQEPLNGRQQVYEGIGRVGETWGNTLGQNFSRKPTITIDSGVGIGILLTSDLTLEEEKESKKETIIAVKPEPKAQQTATASPFSMIDEAIPKQDPSQNPNQEKKEDL